MKARISGIEKRRLRRDLIVLLEAVEVYLRAGFELGYAWSEAHAALKEEAQSLCFDGLAPEEDKSENLSACLARLMVHYLDPLHRPWFSVLAELYAAGAPLSGAIGSLAETLRAEETIEMEAHLRRLPTRANSILLIFFLPPALLLIFAPLVKELLNSF